jgi:hypothetical protein
MVEFPMITIEGIKVKAKAIPKKELLGLWKVLTSKPLPKVKAFQLSDDDFDRVIRLRRCEEDMQRELEEWGKVLSTEDTDACVFNDAETIAEYVILVRENPYHNISKILEHELSHIAREDF